MYVPAGFTSNVRGFELGDATSVTSRATTIADEGFNPSFMNRAVNPVFTASVAHYNAIKASSFWKATLDAGIAAAAASFPGSAARQSLLTPAQTTAVRLNTASPIGGLASTLGVIFLFVQAQVSLMMIHPMIMPLFGKIKFKHYINIRRAIAYGMTTCFVHCRRSHRDIRHLQRIHRRQNLDLPVFVGMALDHHLRPHHILLPIHVRPPCPHCHRHFHGAQRRVRAVRRPMGLPP